MFSNPARLWNPVCLWKVCTVSYNWSELLFLYALTLHLHAHLQALSETTELAAVAMVFVDHTVPVTAAVVCQTLAHTSLEESLTAFAADRPIMPPFKYTNPHIVYLEIKIF